MEPSEALERIAFLLEREQASTYPVQAFRHAAQLVSELSQLEVLQRAVSGRLTELEGIGPTTARVIAEAAAGRTPEYLADLEQRASAALTDGGLELRAALRGDCHLHSDWSDGGSPIEAMVRAARGLGHSWAVLTDHSPRLRIARGLSAERLREQIDVVAQLNERTRIDERTQVNGRAGPFRLLTGIECDILTGGALDQEDELLERLDVVVASVHSDLRMGREAMTRRLIRAVSDPRVDILGHCTGRLVGARSRPESVFDAEAVFAACAERGTAVEINCRPERLDPSRRLLRQAADAGVLFAIDSDAHAPGQLDWQIYGCARAEEAGVPVERVVTSWTARELLTWTRTRRMPARTREA
jgi:putative hydrolase